jgi:molybdate transport system substrate-binding protein
MPPGLQPASQERFITKRCAFVLAFLAAQFVVAQSALSVLASNGMKTVVDRLKPAAEKSIGQLMIIEFNSVSGLRPKLESGQGYDAAVVTTENGRIGQIRENRGRLASRLARGAIGLGVREDASKPDIKTSEALKRALLNAKGVAYA